MKNIKIWFKTTKLWHIYINKKNCVEFISEEEYLKSVNPVFKPIVIYSWE